MMEQLINFQEDIFFRISKARTNYKKAAKDKLTKEYIEGRLEAVEYLWFEFLSGHKELMRSQNIDAIQASSYIKNETYDKCDEIFLEYKTELKIKLSKFSMPSGGSNKSTGEKSARANVKLPKVNIDTFSGKCYSEWSTFRDLFRSLIHQNSDLDDVQKLLYLKGYLNGEAGQLLSNIPITQDNYVRAWELLEDRYDNKKYISHQILERLLSQRSMAQESASGLKEILDTTNDCLAALSNVGIKTENWDILVIHIISKRLDPESRRQWEFSIADGSSSEELPNYKQFQEFLTKRYRALEFLDAGFKTTDKKQGLTSVSVNKTNSMHIIKGQCSFCLGEHTLTYCTSFKKMSVELRFNFVQSNKICFCCLGGNHTANTCRRNMRCPICGRRHHVLLHQESVEEHVADSSKNDVSGDTESTPSSGNNHGAEMTASLSVESASSVSCFMRKQNPVLLATALVNTVSKKGQCLTIRALLDQGSQSSFITEEKVQQLGLKITSTNIQVTGVGGDKAIVSKAIVNINISSRIDPQVVIHVEARVLKSITSSLPTCKIKEVVWKEIHGKMLADPGYHTPNRVDMLLGAEVYGRILQNGFKRGPQGSLIAQCTSLGWILSGALDSIGGVSEIKTMHIVDDTNFLECWKQEDDVSLSKEIQRAEEEKLCKELFTKTMIGVEDDVVLFPLKKKDPVAETSRENYERKLIGFGREVETDDLKQKVKKVNENSVELLLATKVNNLKVKYLPHHALMRVNKHTTWIQAVIGATCKESVNKSPNDSLFVKLNLQTDLKLHVMHWKVYRIPLIVDFVVVNSQRKIVETKANYQRVIRKGDTAKGNKKNRMQLVKQAKTSASWIAVRALQQLLLSVDERYVAASKAGLRQFHMEAKGVNSDEIGNSLQQRICKREELKSGMKESKKKRDERKEISNLYGPHARVELSWDENVSVYSLNEWKTFYKEELSNLCIQSTLKILNIWMGVTVGDVVKLHHRSGFNDAPRGAYTAPVNYHVDHFVTRKPLTSAKNKMLN